MQLRNPAVFAGAIRSARLARGLTQEELAEGAGKSRRWVHDLESGSTNPSLSAVIAVASFLGLTLSLEQSERSDVLDEIFEDL